MSNLHDTMLYFIFFCNIFFAAFSYLSHKNNNNGYIDFIVIASH